MTEPVHFSTLDAAYEAVMESAIPLFRGIVTWLQFHEGIERPTRAQVLEAAVKALEGIADPDAYDHADGDEQFYREWVERDAPLPAIAETQWNAHRSRGLRRGVSKSVAKFVTLAE